ncbi:unnamed protein product [Sphagnum balticum]
MENRLSSLILTLGFAALSFGAIPVRQAANEKQNHYLDSGVFVGGADHGAVSLLNVRHNLKDVERIVLDTGPKVEDPNIDRPTFFHAAIQESPRRIVVDLENVTDSKVTADQIAQARVFNFDEQTFSTYLRGTGGFTNLQKTGFAPGLPAGTSFPDSPGVTQAFSGEIGVGFTTKRVLTTRLGVELFYPYASGGVTGKNTAGAPLLTMSNQLYGIIPQVNFEFFVKQGPWGRIYMGGGAGYGICILNNVTSLTPLGQSTYGIGNYTEAATATTIMGQGFLGVEVPAFDNVSISFDLGYRYLNASNYTSNGGYQSALGSVAAGSTIKNVDGSNRSTDLSGIYGAINLRLYIMK